MKKCIRCGERENLLVVNGSFRLCIPCFNRSNKIKKHRAECLTLTLFGKKKMMTKCAVCNNECKSTDMVFRDGDTEICLNCHIEEPKERIENILEEANRLTSEDRNKHYGHPYDNFKTISEFWGTYLNFEVSKRDVSMMMALVKIARDKNMPKRDNLTDLAGYARTAEMVEEKEHGLNS